MGRVGDSWDITEKEATTTHQSLSCWHPSKGWNIRNTTESQTSMHIDIYLKQFLHQNKVFEMFRWKYHVIRRHGKAKGIMQIKLFLWLQCFPELYRYFQQPNHELKYYQMETNGSILFTPPSFLVQHHPWETPESTAPAGCDIRKAWQSVQHLSV